eukprot:GHRQ01023093.1.p1 GENE.GHRQ01023093.1~~GHRQ01023093.1.p1  ORF type:complete len:154 (+),score=38.99 GHRQ01023093.1:514-975(+)
MLIRLLHIHAMQAVRCTPFQVVVRAAASTAAAAARVRMRLAPTHQAAVSGALSSMAGCELPSTQLSEFTQRQLGSDVIDFSAGQPGPRLLPLDMVAAGAAHRLTGAAADPYILQYGTVQGYSSFRCCLAAFLSDATHHTVDPDELLITAGGLG